MVWGIFLCCAVVGACVAQALICQQYLNKGTFFATWWPQRHSMIVVGSVVATLCNVGLGAAILVGGAVQSLLDGDARYS